MRVRKIIRLGVFTAALLVAIELISSYLLYVHYAWHGQTFRPTGLASVALTEYVWHRGQALKVSVDHGPLFGPDAALGFIMYPGHYNVTEKSAKEEHVFQLTVTDQGWRATSYVPVHAPHRIYLTGDSALFGWGTDDEQTVAWLLQTRLPNYEVLNLSAPSYSTIHALLQLRQLAPKISPDDIVLVLYHPVTNEFNVQSPFVLQGFAIGYEVQLSDKAQMDKSSLPFGAVDADGKFSIKQISVSCILEHLRPAQCAHPELDDRAQEQVTERAMDEIIALKLGRLVVAQISGADDDPVIKYLRSKAVRIADLRSVPRTSDGDEIIPIDGHVGPFWHHLMFRRLLGVLQRDGLVD
jgi:hypothetical protein